MDCTLNSAQRGILYFPFILNLGWGGVGNILNLSNDGKCNWLYSLKNQSALYSWSSSRDILGLKKEERRH